MPENDNEKDFNETVESNVRKAFGDDNVSDVMCGNPDEIKKMVEERNKKAIDKAEENGMDVAHISIKGIDDIAFPFDEHLVVASDDGVAVIGDLEPKDLADVASNIVKADLISWGISPDDKVKFNMNAALVLLLSASDFINSGVVPYKIVKRFSRLMEAYEELIED